MKKNLKFLAVLVCAFLAAVFAAAPTAALATEATPAVVTTAEVTTTKQTEATTTTTAKKTTTKATTTTTKKKTTSSGGGSSSGKLTVTSKRSDESSGDDGKVKVIYTISNTGSVTAKNIKLKDADIAGSKVIETIDSLSAGDKKTIEYTATMTRDSVSAPVLTCTMNGTSRTFNGESVKIALKGSGSSSSLSATISTSATDVKPNEPVKFSLVIKNDDTKAITDISVTDYAGKSIKSGMSIQGGSTETMDFELTLTGDTNVYVTVKGKNSSGSEVSAKSNELAIKANAEAVPVSEGISAFIRADKTELDKKDEVVITLEIKNLMPKEFKDIKIIDKNTNQTLQTISVLSGNDTKTYESVVEVEKDTTFAYELMATYEDGTSVTVQSNSIEVKVGSKGFLSGGMTIIIVIIAIILLLIIATSITLIILSRKEKNRKKSIGAAQSEKFRPSTPKKKDSRVKMQQPASTFTINESDAPQQKTAPVQPINNSAFDHYGENVGANLGGFENENANSFGSGFGTSPNGSQSFGGGQSFGSGSSFNGTSSAPTFGSSINEAPNSSFGNGANASQSGSMPFNNSQPVSSGPSAFSKPAPAQPASDEPAAFGNPAPSEPASRKPMNYNDLDPD